MSARTRTVSTQPDHPSVASDLARFLTTATVTSLAWYGVLITVFFAPTHWWEQVGLVALMVGSVLPSVVIHRIAPSDPMDRFHRLGILFAMFLTMNITITSVSLGYGFWTETAHYFTDLNVIFLVSALSSLALPGPYVGVVLARRWAR